MTLPLERKNAVLNTEQFLLRLCDPKSTPRLPKSVREDARRLLKHYPTKFDMLEISTLEDSLENRYQVFGNK
jgi:hypothetical protein